MKVVMFGRCQTQLLIASALVLLATVFPVCTGSVGWAQTLDLSKPFTLARMNVGIVGGSVPAEAPSCTTLAQSYDTVANEAADNYVGVPGYENLAMRITVGGTAYSVCKVEAYIKRTASTPSNGIYARFYTDSSGPSSQTGSNSDTVAGSSVSTSYGWVTFTFSTPVSLSASTNYWLVLSTAQSDWSIYYFWYNNGSAGTGLNNYRDADGSGSWPTQTYDGSNLYKIYK